MTSGQASFRTKRTRTADTGSGWVVPKKYVERVGDDGLKKAPAGAGPFKVASFTPGIGLALEAGDSHQRDPSARGRTVVLVTSYPYTAPFEKLRLKEKR